MQQKRVVQDVEDPAEVDDFFQEGLIFARRALAAEVRDVVAARLGDLKAMAAALERSADFRVLRRLVPHVHAEDVDDVEPTSTGVFLDCETTPRWFHAVKRRRSVH